MKFMKTHWNNQFFGLSLVFVASLGAVSGLAGADEKKEADTQAGTITQTLGTVQLFTQPMKKISESPESPPPHALFEGMYYSVKTAKVGDVVENGDIIRTAPGAKARVVYQNGDQFNVGSATSYKIAWNKDSGKSDVRIQLMYGKIRGIISKGGPRNRLRVRTVSATMGVRGTDFYIFESVGKGTEVSVLRGAVGVKPAAGKAPAAEIKAGFSAAVNAATSAPAVSGANPPLVQPSIELFKTSKQEIQEIQKASEISQVPVAQQSTTVAALESQAVQTTLNDIKEHDPVLYSKIQAAPAALSVEDLNRQSLQAAVEQAPVSSPRRKPKKSELEDLNSDVYQKYFPKDSE